MLVNPQQLEEALKYCNDFAVHMLSDAGEFYPFGAFINPSGELVSVGGHIGEEFPDPIELLKFLDNAMNSRLSEGEAIATALAINVNIPPKYSATYSDGIKVTLKADGHHRSIYTPYKIQKTRILKFRPKVKLIESFSVEHLP